jgi:hypothetical protein
MKSLFLSLLCLISVVSTAQSTLKVGDEVTVNWKEGGTYYPGKIAEIKDTLYFINYNDGDSEWTSAKNIKLTEFVWPENSSKDFTSKFKVGDAVDVIEEGIWYDATVLKVNKGQYYIHYEGWSSMYDIVVNNDQIRARTKKATSTTPQSSSTTNSSSASTSSDKVTFKIQNTCLKDVVMLIDDVQYPIARNSSITVTVKVGAHVYALTGSKKSYRGVVSATDYVNVFYPDCN